MLEINGLSDVGTEIMVLRSKFALIEAMTVTGWRKEADAFRAVMRERNRSKVGRMPG